MHYKAIKKSNHFSFLVLILLLGKKRYAFIDYDLLSSIRVRRWKLKLQNKPYLMKYMKN